MTQTEFELKQAVEECEKALSSARLELLEFQSTPEYHTYPDLETASYKLESYQKFSY